jgi:hypothetical protein
MEEDCRYARHSHSRIFWNRLGVDVGGRYKRHSRFEEEDVKNKGRINIVKMIEILEVKR